MNATQAQKTALVFFNIRYISCATRNSFSKKRSLP